MERRAEDGAVCKRWASRGLPGTPVACSSPVLGVEFSGPKGLGTLEVIGCALPLPPSPGRVKRGSSRLCEGAFLTRHKSGEEFVFPKSRVRDWVRAPSRGGLCPDWLSDVEPSALLDLSRRARDWGVTEFEAFGGEFPFPHRKGSSVCCSHSPHAIGRLRELERDAFEGGAADVRRFVRALREACDAVEDCSSRVKVRGQADAQKVFERLSEHCVNALDRWAAKGRGKARFSAAREAAEKRQAAIRRGEDVTDAEYLDTLAGRRGKRPLAQRFRVGV